MKKVFLLILPVLLLLAFRPTDEGSEISWRKDRPLTWDDFQAEPDDNTSMKAMTYSRIGAKTEYQNNELQIIVYSFFDKSKSWTKDPKNDRLLQHEQLHFDITELYTRIIRQKVAQVKETDPQKKVNEAFDLINEMMDEWGKEQEKYDEETNHGLITEKQEAWTKDIASRMKKLEDFASERR